MLLTAFAMESRTVDGGMLDEVSRDLHLDWPGGTRVWEDVRPGARV